MTEFFRLSTEESLQQLEVQSDQGLNDQQIAARREQYGRNELPSDEGINWVELIIGQFSDLMVIILLIAAGISVAVAGIFRCHHHPYYRCAQRQRSVFIRSTAPSSHLLR